MFLFIGFYKDENKDGDDVDWREEEEEKRELWSGRVLDQELEKVFGVGDLSLMLTEVQMIERLVCVLFKQGNSLFDL